MKLREVIANLDKSKPETVDYDELTQELGVEYIGWIEQDRLVYYWIANHLCTDTWVGIRAYFLDDELVCVSNQSARKSDENFKWVRGKEIAVRDYLNSLVQYRDYDYLDMDEDLGEGYHVQFPSQLLAKKLIYKGQIQLVEGNPRLYDPQFIKLQGRENPVNINECLVPFNLKETI